jgi:hypothetical protein
MMWLDRNHRFFVAMTCSIGDVEKISCMCFRQLNKSGRVPLDKVIIKVTLLKAIVMYYSDATTIQNRICTNELQMDCNLVTKNDNHVHVSPQAQLRKSRTNCTAPTMFGVSVASLAGATDYSLLKMPLLR